MKTNKLPTDTEINVNELPKIASQLNQKIKSNVSNRNVFRIPKTYYIWVIFLILSIAISSLAGVSLGKLNSKETVKTQGYTVTKSINVFPIDIAILQNPMFSDWSGRLKGRIRELRENSFAISAIKEDFKPNGEIIVTDRDNSNLTEIEVVPGLTQFFVSSPSSSFGQTPIPISFGEVKNSAIVEGNVKIRYDATLSILKLAGVSFTLR